MFERFTTASRGVVMRAQEESRQLNDGRSIGTEHLLLGLLGDDRDGAEVGPSIARDVLRATGLTAAHVRSRITELADPPAAALSDEDAAALRSVGIDLDTVLSRITQSFGPDALSGPKPAGRRGLFGRRRPGSSRFTPRAKKVLELSLRETLRQHTDHIGTEHILLGLLREGEGLAAKILADSGADLGALQEDTLRAIRRAA